MKRIMRVLILISFVYLLKADEDAIPDEGNVDYASIELAHPPKDDASDNKTLDQDDAHLKVPTSDEVYKAAPLSIQYKNASSEPMTKKDENAVQSLNNTDTAGTTQSVKDKSILETKSLNNTYFNEKNQTLNEKDISAPESKILNEQNSSTLEKELDRKSDSELVDNYLKTDSLKPSIRSSTTSKPKAAIDDMDDLIFPYELDKSRKSYDDDEYDRSVYSETQNAPEESDSELEGLDNDFQPRRRMFDSLPVLDLKGRSENHELLEPSTPIISPRTPIGVNLDLSDTTTFSPILFPNRPESIIPLRPKNLQLPHNFNQKPNPSLTNTPNYHLPTKWELVDIKNGKRRHGASQELLSNPNIYRNSDETKSDPIRFGDLREMLNPNSRDTLFGNEFHNAAEKSPNNPNRLGISQEMVNNPNRMAQEEDISVPNRWDQPPRSYIYPNRWIPYMMTVPYKWTQAPRIQNIPIGWVHPRVFNTLNNPTRTKQSQEIYDPPDFETNAILSSTYDPMDTNDYPYVSAKAAKAEESINPIFRKLVQASNLPQSQLPIYGIIRYPDSYSTFDPSVTVQKNFALVPRSRRFSIGSGFQNNRMCCY